MTEMEQSDPRYLLVNTAKVLRELHIPYIVTGGMAVLVWGRIRFTADIDIVIELQREYLDGFVRALGILGGPYGYIDKEMVKDALVHNGEFNFIDGNSGVKVDFWVVGNNAISRQELKRAVVKIVNGQDVSFISPEDLILSKLRWYKKSESVRHLEDIESVLKISKVDKAYLKKEAQKQNTDDILKTIL